MNKYLGEDILSLLKLTSSLPAPFKAFFSDFPTFSQAKIYKFKVKIKYFLEKWSKVKKMDFVLTFTVPVLYK